MQNYHMKNTTEETEFTLLGFGMLRRPVPIFLTFLTIYVTTLCGNFIIIVLVSQSHVLHAPMYLFLMHLSLCDMVFTTNLVPNIFQSILEGVIKISIVKWVSQFCVYGMSTVAECLILTTMSYDRYLAICKPLHYTSTMGFSTCHKLVGLSWLVGALTVLNSILNIFTKPFCGPKLIDHFICDISPLIKLSCSDLFAFQMFIYTLSIPLLFTPFVFILLTYIQIFIAINNIISKDGRKKTFSTCSSHLTSVSIFYGSLIMVYAVPNRGQLVTTKVVFLLYTVVTPLLNPIIYSIRNKEIRKALEMLFYLQKNMLLTSENHRG